MEGMQPMFQHILVPLDGSRRAESAVPVAANIARATGGALLFVRVVALADDTATDSRTASAYLEHQARRTDLEGISVQTRMLTGMAAQQILANIETQAIDLVVMSSRGETGLKRWALGSVAQKVLRKSSAPVLILH